MTRGPTGWRRKCEHLLALDIRKLHRKELLRPGSLSGWQWTLDGEPSGSISVRAQSSGTVELSYAWTPDGQPKLMRYPVDLAWTPCRFGGARPWFKCPRCACRRAVLYGVASDGRFGCCYCMHLAYSSEAESPIDRCWRAQRKIEAWLTEDGERPTGMHKRTFERLCDKWDALEERKDEFWLPGFLRLARRLGFDPNALL